MYNAGLHACPSQPCYCEFEVEEDQTNKGAEVPMQLGKSPARSTSSNAIVPWVITHVSVSVVALGNCIKFCVFRCKLVHVVSICHLAPLLCVVSPEIAHLHSAYLRAIYSYAWFERNDRHMHWLS